MVDCEAPVYNMKYNAFYYDIQKKLSLQSSSILKSADADHGQIKMLKLAYTLHTLSWSTLERHFSGRISNKI